MPNPLLSQLDSSWLTLVGEECQKPYFKALEVFLEKQNAQHKVIFPKQEEVFCALNHTLPKDVKVVILGQDPYHGPGQAHGMAFSVKDECKLPPSLKNIFKELESDVGFKMPQSGNLTSWADQGVLLLNSVLTVEQAEAGSHRAKGWEVFTDAIIQALVKQQEHIVFILWGAYAMKKKSLIDTSKHHVLIGPHPSPLSAYRGFFGCRHFSMANDVLKQWGREPINWQL